VLADIWSVTGSASAPPRAENLPGELAEFLVQPSEDRAGYARRVTELLEVDRATFFKHAIQAVIQGQIQPAHELALLEVLAEQGCLLPLFQGVYAADRLRYREVLRRMNAADPRLHARLGKRLTALLALNAEDHIDDLLCLFDSVADLGGWASLAAMLPQLTGAKDPRLRARGALVRAVLPNGRHLLELYRAEPDPRARACLLELLWMGDQPVARLVFEEARRDVQPRVRAFGLLGLYQLGDTRTLAALAEMAESPQALTRAVARFAMEVLYEPRFDGYLRALRLELGDQPPKRMPISPAVRCGSRPIDITIPRVQRLPGGRLSVVLSACLDEDQQLDPPLRPLDLRAWTDGRPVLNYITLRTVPPRRLGVAAILPLRTRALAQTSADIEGVLELLMAMPDGELRAAGFYRSGLFMRQVEEHEGAPAGASEIPHEADPAPCLPFVAQDHARFSAEVRASLREENLAAEPGELACAMLPRLMALRPVGHLVVAINDAAQGPPKPAVFENLCESMKSTGCMLHLIAVGRVHAELLASWRALNRLGGGFYRHVRDEEEIPEVIHYWMRSFRERFSLEFDAPESASTLRIQAVHPAGSGEITVPIDESGDEPPPATP
jgi:hypothetical protein